MHYNKVSFLELLHCFDNDFVENNAWNLEHNAVELQEILNRIMQRIMDYLMFIAAKTSKQKQCNIATSFRLGVSMIKTLKLCVCT